MRTTTELRAEAQRLRDTATGVADPKLLVMMRELIAELELRAKASEDDDDWDICRVANMLIERHGTEAVLEAAGMLDTMLDRGDLEGRAVWRLIMEAIVRLQEPPSGLLH